MNPEEITKVLDDIETRLGSMEPLTELLIHQYVVSNIIYAVVDLIFVVVLTALIVWAIKKAKKVGEDSEYFLPLLGMCALAALLLTLAICGLTIDTVEALAPHYHILKSLLGD